MFVTDTGNKFYKVVPKDNTVPLHRLNTGPKIWWTSLGQLTKEPIFMQFFILQFNTQFMYNQNIKKTNMSFW